MRDVLSRCGGAWETIQFFKAFNSLYFEGFPHIKAFNSLYSEKFSHI